MTKPKTVSQLLSEANKLARERGMEISEGYQSVGVGRSLGMSMDVWFAPDKSTALRCLIAALREVPVKRGKK